MMYALSILMLLPVSIQHHRKKKALILQRQKELRRLSVTIAQDDENPKQNFAKKLLSQIIERGNIDYKTIPKDIELVSPPPSTKEITLENLQPFIDTNNDNNINEETGIDANDC